MSSRDLEQPKTPSRELVIVAGSFAPAGTGAVTTVRGKGFTVARTGVGAFLITLDRVYPAILNLSGNVQLAAAADMAVQFGAVDLAAKTIAMRTVVAATPTDIAADANNRVGFCLHLQNTSRG